ALCRQSSRGPFRSPMVESFVPQELPMRTSNHRRPIRRLDLETLEARTLPSFVAPLSFDTGGVPEAVAAADFNGDSVLDLVPGTSGGVNVSVLVGSGHGTFQDARNFGTGTAPRAVAVADFNGDGAPDLVTANEVSDNVSVLLGNG